MVEQLTLLLVFQLIGEIVARLTGLPLPGPVIGMGLLFTVLVIRGREPVALAATARGLLENLSLLFVPAGVGVMVNLQLLEDEWEPIAAALVGSTAATIAVTALVMQAIDRLTGRVRP